MVVFEICIWSYRDNYVKQNMLGMEIFAAFCASILAGLQHFQYYILMSRKL